MFLRIQSLWFHHSCVPDEDIIRYNRASKVYGVNVGDYARVTTTDHASNTITVEMEDGRNLTYNPSRLSGVSVYKESTREFAEGDRILFHAPFVEKRIANGELGSIVKIEENEFRVALDSGREVSFEPEKYRHIDHGYAVTSHSSQGTTVDRVLINADARESAHLLNDRMGYVAVSRARDDAIIYTNSTRELREALDRRVDKEMAFEATSHSKNYTEQLREESARDAFLHHQQPGTEPNSDQSVVENDRQQANATDHLAETEEMELEFSL